MPSAAGQMPMLGTLPPVQESPMAGGGPPGGLPPMGPDPSMMGAPPPMGAGLPGFPSTDPMALIQGLTASMGQDQAQLGQAQAQALQIALSAIIEQTAGMADPLAQSAMSEGGQPMSPDMLAAGPPSGLPAPGVGGY